MFRQSPRRNQRNKGFKVKHALIVGVLLGVCIWLLYQVQQSRDKKVSIEESTRVYEKSANGNDIVKLGRKDLQPDLKESSNDDTTREEGQKQEGENRQFDDENKPGEQDRDQDKEREDGEHKGESVDTEKETEETTGKETAEEENREKESKEEGEDGEEKEIDDFRNGVNERTEEGVKSDEEQSGEEGEEDKEKGSIYKENEEKDKGESNENDVVNTNEKSEGTDGEDKVNNEESVQTKENESDETKENGTELDGGVTKQVKQLEDNESEVVGEESKRSEARDREEEGDSPQKEENSDVSDSLKEKVHNEDVKTEEGVSDVSTEVVKEPQNTTASENRSIPHSSGEEQLRENEQNMLGTEKTKSTEATNVKGDTAGSVNGESEKIEQKESSNVTGTEDRGDKTYQVESGDISNLKKVTIEANKQEMDGNSTTHTIQIQKNTTDDVQAGDAIQSVLKERSENESINSDSNKIALSIAKNNSETQGSEGSSNNLEFADANGEHVNHDTTGGIENDSERSSGMENNASIENQKATANSDGAAEEKINPSNDNDNTELGQNRSVDSSRNEDTSSVSNNDAYASQHNQDDSSGPSIPQEGKEVRADLETLPETGKQGNNHEEAAAK